jgi:hypothetical protein
VIRMFRGSQISAYFSSIGSAKSDTVGASSLEKNNGRSANEISFGAIGASHGTPIAIGEGTQIDGSEATPIALSEGNSFEGSHSASVGSSSQPRGYPTSDPRYIHASVGVPKRAREVLESVCNRPRLRRRSNVAVKLIPPVRMSVPVGVVELDAPAQIEPIVHDLSSDNNPAFILCHEQDKEVDPDVLE